MSNTNTGPTVSDRAEALHNIEHLQNWLDSHPLRPDLAIARADRVRELVRWQSYLRQFDRKRRLH